MQKHHHHKHQNNHHTKPRKKRLGLFYGTVSSIAIIAFIAIFYFVIIVSTKPRSILLVTQKIESVLQKEFGTNNVSVGKTYLSFTNYGTLKISLHDLHILHPALNGTGKKSLTLSKLEMEFSLFDFLLLRFQPNKIKVLNPNIFLGEWQTITNPNQEFKTKQSDLSLIAGLLESIRKGKNPIENIEIENAKLLIRSENFEREILLRRSQIHITTKDKRLVIESQNQLNLDPDVDDVNLSSSCQITTEVICNLSVQNLVLNSFAEFHPSLSELNKINAVLDANVSFTFIDNNLKDLKFNIHSKQGDFVFPDFFAKKIDFQNFSIVGEYDHDAKILNLSKVKTDFTDTNNPANKPHLAMSLVIAKIDQSKKFDFNIQLQNVLSDELEKFWPVVLHDYGIHDWVTSHTTGGIITNASTKFILWQNEKGFELGDINAQADLAGINLKYSEDFPEIKNISAAANFTRNGMRIAVLSGEVLQSKISDGLVVIDNFDAKNVILKISGKASGHAANGLQHAHHDPDFMRTVEKHLNGDSQSNFDIRVSLSKDITLKNSYIAVNSDITKLETKYLSGGFSVNSTKDFNSTDFVTKFNLTATKLDLPSLNLAKKPGAESQLSFIVAARNPQKIQIKNIFLRKKEDGNVGKFNGNISFDTAPFLLTSANFRNTNFDKNNYLLTYQANAKSQKISFQGEKINLGTFLSQKSSNQNFSNLTAQVATNRADLLNNKSLRNFYFSLNCTNGLCSHGVLRAGYNKQESIILRIGKTPENNIIRGRISDLGYITEGLGISKVVVGGNTKLKIQHYASNNKPVFKGTMTIDDNITIYENETVKRFNKDTLFSQVRDKIFSSDKTTFDSVKVEFHLQDHKLDIRSLIANNYKIGVTAKGEINLSTKSCHLKGMIVPGFVVNNLFGIGKIPLVGDVISGLLTGGEGGGLFGIRYEYQKNPGDKEGKFTTNKVAAFVPSTIQNLFD